MIIVIKKMKIYLTNFFKITFDHLFVEDFDEQAKTDATKSSKKIMTTPVIGHCNKQ